MAGVTFTIDDREIIGALDRLDGALTDRTNLHHALGAHFVFSTQRNFETETAPDGTPWPRLSPRTAEKRIGRGRRGYDHMLRVTTRLHRSVNYEADAAGVEWGTNVAYGRIHQLGGNVDIPPREGTVRLRSIRQKGGGIRSRFASKRSKTAIEKVVQIRGHQVRIPARPYLGISAYDREAVPQIITDHLAHEVGR
jgi:phage virion morphogenesis protein